MTIIEDFVAHYKREYDFYEMTSKIVSQHLESALQEAGIRALVTYRAKNPERLFLKLQQRNEEQGKKYASFEDIYNDICDLSGVRVALYFPGDRDKVEKIIKEHFILISEPKEFPDEKKRLSYAKRFSGYRAKHYRVQLKESSLNETQKRYIQSKTEIQVASVLMHAWSEVEHDLVYKPLNGNLSSEELSILDELNGLVLVGEMALERLQISGDIRVKKEKIFNNQYELASYLYNVCQNKLEKNANNRLGNVELLFKLMDKCDLKSSTSLQPFLKSISSSKNSSSLCEQIVDNIILGDNERYKIYVELKEMDSYSDEKLQNAIGYFMKEWIHLEQILSKVSPESNRRTRNLFAESNLKRFFDEKEVKCILKLKQSRNFIVHGVELPPIDAINEMACEIKRICSSLKPEN